MSPMKIKCILFLVLGIFTQSGYSCIYPTEDFREEVSAAILWGSLKPDVHNCRSNNFSKISTSEIPTVEPQHKESDPKILSRKKRIIYLQQAPFISAEFRYVFPLFPVDRDLKSVANIEVPINYQIPVSHFDFQIAAKDFASRSGDIFITLEDVLSAFGINGRSCVQRSICEVASLSPLSTKGMLKDILTVVIKYMFRSSPSNDNSNITSPYFQAAMEGRSGKERCDLLFEDCPISLLGLVEHANE